MLIDGALPDDKLRAVFRAARGLVALALKIGFGDALA